MGFKNLKFIILLRVICLCITLVAFVIYFFQYHYYISSFILFILTLFQVTELYKYLTKAHSRFVCLLQSIHYNDFSLQYSEKGYGKSFNQFNEELNKVMRKFQLIHADRETYGHYFKAIVEHVEVGLIGIDQTGEILFINQTAKKILNIAQLKNINDLHPHYTVLLNLLQNIHNHEKKIIKINNQEEFVHLIINSTQIQLQEKYLRILSLQNIQNAVEETEMQAWQNLVRVLTHEIINSVTPIASLAATVKEEMHEASELPQNGEAWDDMQQAINIIQNRSEGLIKFVTDFRSLTKLPSPNFRTFTIVELFNLIEVLLKKDLKNSQISLNCNIEPPTLTLHADPQLLEQVLINLVKNSIQALEEREAKKIILEAFLNENNKVIIQVKDNGAGISEEAQKNIFIPFFTTKKTGSGIGLSLSRQIMRMHGGSIKVFSIPKEETIFTLVFN